MRKAKEKILLFLMLTLIGLVCCGTIFVYAVETSSDAVAESFLPENVVSEALQIINAAGEEGLTESDLKQLAALGLTESQIEMLKNFSLAENFGSDENTDRLFDSWITKQSGWNDDSSACLVGLGVIIAGGLIGLLLMIRKLFFSKNFRRISKRRHSV